MREKGLLRGNTYRYGYFPNFSAMSAGAVPTTWCNQQLLIGAVWTSPSDHTFIWINGAPWNAYSNSLWALGQPDNFLGAENTAQLNLFSFAGGPPGTKMLE
jgi:hypothetical protein